MGPHHLVDLWVHVTAVRSVACSESVAFTALSGLFGCGSSSFMKRGSPNYMALHSSRQKTKPKQSCALGRFLLFVRRGPNTFFQSCGPRVCRRCGMIQVSCGWARRFVVLLTATAVESGRVLASSQQHRQKKRVCLCVSSCFTSLCGCHFGSGGQAQGTLGCWEWNT